MTSLDASRLAEIRERAEKATEGPWFGSGGGLHVYGVIDGAPVAEFRRRPDAAFAQHARTDVPDLLAEVERLTAEVAEVRATIAMSEHARVRTIETLLEALGITDDHSEADAAELLDGCDCNGEQGTDHLVWHLAQKVQCAESSAAEARADRDALAHKLAEERKAHADLRAAATGMAQKWAREGDHPSGQYLLRQAYRNLARELGALLASTAPASDEEAGS